MRKHLTGYCGIIAGVVAISFSPLAVKVVGFTPAAGAFYRSFYAAVFFLLIALWKFRSQASKAHLRWLWPSVGAGVFLGIDLVLWHKSIVYIGAGPATFLGNSQIIFMTLFAAAVFRERIRPAFFASVAAVLTGLYLLLPSVILTVSRMEGYVMGLAVGLTYAGMLICLRYAKTQSDDEYPEIFSLFVCFAASAITIAAYTAVEEPGSLFYFDARSHALIALTAFFCQTLGWYVINTNITRIPAHEGSLLLMLQPVLATVWGSLLFREELGLVQLGGILLSLFGIALYQLYFSGKSKGEQ